MHVQQRASGCGAENRGDELYPGARHDTVTDGDLREREKAIHPRHSDLRTTDRSRMAQRGGIEAAQDRGRVADPEDSTRHRTEAAGDAGDAGDAGENS